MAASILPINLPTEAGLRRELDVSEVDRISQALGHLMAEAEESRRQRIKLDHKLDRLEREHIQIAGLLRSHIQDSNRRQDESMHRYESQIAPTLDDYRSMKNRAIGVLAVVATLGAGMAELVRHLIVKVMG